MPIYILHISSPCEYSVCIMYTQVIMQYTLQTAACIRLACVHSF